MAPSVVAAWAESYAACSWRVFPANGKVPAFRGWQQAATTDINLIRRWWPRDDWTTNVATVTGESFDVFDIEHEHLPAFTSWMRAGDRAFPMTPVARSGRGGLHIFTAPVGVDGTRKLVLDGIHIGELKARGGLIILCPSVTTGQYRWRFAPAGMAVAAAPDWLRTLVHEPPPEPPPRRLETLPEMIGALEVLAEVVAGSRVTTRNAMLFWAARKAAREGIDIELATPALTRAAVAAGLDLDLDEDGTGGVSRTRAMKAIQATIESGYANAAKEYHA